MENNIKLPHGYSVKGGQIVRHWKDKHGEHEEIIANGTFEVISIKQYIGTPDDPLVTVSFMSTTAKRFQDVDIPISEITGSGKRFLRFHAVQRQIRHFSDDVGLSRPTFFGR